MSRSITSWSVVFCTIDSCEYVAYTSSVSLPSFEVAFSLSRVNPVLSSLITIGILPPGRPIVVICAVRIRIDFGL